MNDVEQKSYECIEKFTNLIDAGEHQQSPLTENADIPLVTITYAQSLDGFLGRRGQRTFISSQESIIFTHALRACHDAILVGIGTVLTDNPSLTTRYVSNPHPRQGFKKSLHPRPIILDPRLRIPLNSKLLHRNSILVALKSLVTLEQIDELRRHGCVILFGKPSAQDPTKIDIKDCLSQLRALDIQTIMVEGGGRIISSFLELQSTDNNVIDKVIVTLAPFYIGGKDGIRPYDASSEKRLVLQHTERFGQDIILFLSL